MQTIYNAIGIIIKDRKLLVMREKGQRLFLLPGGGLEAGEKPETACIRELGEELGVKIDHSRLKKFKTFIGPDKGRKYCRVMATFFISGMHDELTPGREIEELKWLESNNSEALHLELILRNQVIPELKLLKLIS